MKKIFALTLILEFSLFFIIFFFTERFGTIKTSYRQLGSFCGEFPGSKPEWEEDRNWKGYVFKEGLRLFFHPHKNPIKNLEDIKFYNFKGSSLIISYIPLGDSAFIAFKPIKKGYQVTTVIALDTVVLWIDIISYRSTLDAKFQYFVNFLGTLRYNDNLLTRPNFSNTISAFRRKISILQMQSKNTLFAFIFGVILIANILAFSAFFVGGACPKNPGIDWELFTPNVMVYEKSPMGQRSYSACLVKRGDEMLILVFKKVRKALNIEEIRNNLRFHGKTMIIGGSLRLELPDEDALSKWQAIL